MIKKKRITREGLLNTATELIMQNGLERLSVRSLCSVLGIGKGSFYTYFASKNDLMISVVRYVAADRLDRSKVLIANIVSPLAQLEKLIVEPTDGIQEFSAIYAMIYDSHQSIRALVATEYLNNYIRFVANIIQDGIEAGELVDIDPVSLATMLITAHDFLATARSVNTTHIDPDVYRQTVLRLITK